jgi:hypothetical protein
MGRAAFAEAEYDRAYSQLMGALAQAKMDFSHSPDFVAARHELDEAQQAYDSARQAVLAKLLNSNAEYRAALEKHTEADITLKNTSGLRVQNATHKMEVGSFVTQMEAAALNADANVQNAKARLATAQQKLSDLQYRYESQLSAQPAVVSAKQSYDIARSMQAGAEGYLSGALITRSDAIDADYRRFPPSYLYMVYPNYNFNPYLLGYYGLTPGRF